MTYTKALKMQAKKQLQGNWAVAVAGELLLAVAAVLFCCVLSAFAYLYEITEIESISYFLPVILIISAFILSPFLLGYLRLCYRISQGTKAQLSEMFFYFSSRRLYRKALSICFGFLLRYVAFFSPFVILSAIALGLDRNSSLVLFILISGVFLALFLSLRYAAAPFLLFENEDMKPNVCFSYARTIYKLQKKSIARLILSFFAWFLLLFFVLPALYIIPYVTVTICNFEKWSIFNSLPFFEQNT